MLGKPDLAQMGETKMCFLIQVEEVRRHSHCLAFSSAGPQSQTYYVSYDSYTEHLRWQRTASKVQIAWVGLSIIRQIRNILNCDSVKASLIMSKNNRLEMNLFKVVWCIMGVTAGLLSLQADQLIVNSCPPPPPLALCIRLPPRG